MISNKCCFPNVLVELSWVNRRCYIRSEWQAWLLLSTINAPRGSRTKWRGKLEPNRPALIEF